MRLTLHFPSPRARFSRRWIWAAAVALAAISVPLYGANTEKYSRAPEAQKISNTLLRMEIDVRTRGLALTEAARPEIYTYRDGALLLDVLASPLDENVAKKFEIPGVSVLSAHPRTRRMTVAVSDISRIFDIAQIGEVIMVRPQFRFQTRVGAVEDEGIIKHRTDIATQIFSVDGTGVNVGIISDSFARTANVRDGDTVPAAGVPGTLMNSIPQDSGDIPSGVTLLNDSLPPPSATDEGAGMAEIIHDLAPGANLFFHGVGNSEADFAQAIRNLRNAGCDIIVDDIGFPTEPFYQHGIVSLAVDDVVTTTGVAYFSAAGNDANFGYRQPYVDSEEGDDPSPAEAADGSDFHQWSVGGDNFLSFTLPPGALTNVILQWNQPFNSVAVSEGVTSGTVGAEIDLDLYIFGGPGPIGSAIAVSDDRQGTTDAPSGDPIEVVGIVNIGATPVTLYAAVDHFDGNKDVIPQGPEPTEEDPGVPLELRIVFFGGVSAVEGVSEFSPTTGGPTIFGHPYAPGAVAVGATFWDQDFTGAPNTIFPELFTSRGSADGLDLPLFFNELGQYQPNVFAISPQMAAVDGTNTFTFLADEPAADTDFDGFPNFFGTSAAAPHAVAIAAMILQQNPMLTPDEVTLIMQNATKDIAGAPAAAGFDAYTGAGIVDAPVALGLESEILTLLDAAQFSLPFDTSQILGLGIAGVGDVNNDGYSDLMIGSGFAGPQNMPQRGEAYLVLGRPGGFIPARDRIPPTYNVTDESIVQFIGEVSFDQAGYTIAGADDVNRDGFDDILIGAWRHDKGLASDAGKVYLILGRPDDAWPANGIFPLANADASFVGELANDFAGFAIAGVGDVDGDMNMDFLIGAYGNDQGGGTPGNIQTNAGKAYLIRGVVDVVGTYGQNFPLANADARFVGESLYDKLGYAVGRADDINGDGFNDFLIGAYNNDDGAGSGLLNTGGGKAYLIYGGPTMGGGAAAFWAANRPVNQQNVFMSTAIQQNAPFLSTFLGTAEAGELGRAVSGIGDTDADGRFEFSLGEPGLGLTPLEEGSGQGRSYIFAGDPVKYPLQTTVAFENEKLSTPDGIGIRSGAISTQSRFGMSVAKGGNFDGSGQSFLLSGGPFNTVTELIADPFRSGDTFPIQRQLAGVANLIRMIKSDNPLREFPYSGLETVIFGEFDQDNFGMRVAGVGDVDLDGFEDILIAAQFNDDESLNKGKAYLFFGNPPGNEEEVEAIAARFSPAGAAQSDFGSAGRVHVTHDDGPASKETVRLWRKSVPQQFWDGGLSVGLAKVHWQVTSTRALSGAQGVFQYTNKEIAYVDENGLTLYYAPSLNGPWTIVSGQTHNPDNNTITAPLPEAGYYTLAGPPVVPTGIEDWIGMD